jgi:hypothetical protein
VRDHRGAGAGPVGEEDVDATERLAHLGAPRPAGPEVLVVLAGESGTPAGAARAAAQQAPNMCAWTRSAAAGLGSGHAAKHGSGTHCRFPPSSQISGCAPCRRASSMPARVAQPQCRTEAIRWPRSSRIIDSCARPGSSWAMTRARNTDPPGPSAGGRRSRVERVGSAAAATAVACLPDRAVRPRLPAARTAGGPRS